MDFGMPYLIETPAIEDAAVLCRELGLQPIGASDAHVIKQIGKYATWLPEKVDNLADFIDLLRSRPVKPAIFNGIGYDVMDEF